MTIGGVKPGDVVSWDDGLVHWGRVLDRISGGLLVSYLTRPDLRPVRVKARDVTGHYRKSGATKRREEGRG